MLRKALTTAVLLAATLAGTDARATSSVRLSVETLDERITLATDRRAWSHHGQWRHKGVKRRGNSFHRGNGFAHRGKGYHRGNGFAHRGSGLVHRGKGFVGRGNGFTAKRVGRGVVIVRPSYRSFRYQYRSMPLIRKGSVARRPYRW